MGNKLAIDVCVVSYNSHEELKECLESLFLKESQDIGHVFVIENGSRGIKKDIKERFRKCTFIENKKNLGFSRACNIGIKISISPYICLLNPDTVIKKNFFRRAISFFENNPEIAVIGPKIVEKDGSIQQSARGFPTLHTAFFGRRSLFSKLFPQNPLSKKNLLATKSSSPMEVDWVSGACLLARRKAIDEIGLMDERFFMYWEDCDWCTRFKRAGWKIIYHPGLGPVLHITGTSSKKEKIKSIFWFHKSALSLYKKYDESPLHVGTLIVFLGAVIRGLFFTAFSLLRRA